MTRDQTRLALLDVFAALDYDLYKSFLPDCAEDPRGSQILLDELVTRFQDSMRRAEPPKLSDVDRRQRSRSAGQPRSIEGFRGTKSL
jgi:hypothetical protein